jgi:branched-chain amino acid transport system permease protein
LTRPKQKAQRVDALLQTIIDGLFLGAVLALAAVGFSLIFGVLNVLNLSHGVFVVAGAFLSNHLLNEAGVDPVLSLPVVMAAGAALGYLTYAGLIGPAIKRGTLISALLVTFGLALIGTNALMLLFSSEVRSISPAYAFTSFRLGTITIEAVRLVGFLASILLVGLLTLFLGRTKSGRIIRATAQQELAARLCGVDVDRVFALTFAVASAFAAASGAIMGMMLPFSPAEEVRWTVNAFIVVVLGGVGSPAGALVGGLLLGLANTLTAQVFGSVYTNVAMFMILLVMLLVRPNGLLGAAFKGSR